jgi:hypothetical protein
MRIKDPVLVGKKLFAVYIVDVEGKKVEVTYSYDMDNEQAGGWHYDLEPCYVDLTDDEIEDLEEEFANVVLDISVGGVK